MLSNKAAATVLGKFQQKQTSGTCSYVVAFMNDQTLAPAFLVRFAPSIRNSPQTWTSAERFQDLIHLDVIYFKSQQKIH